MATKKQKLYKASWAARKDNRIVGKTTTAIKKGGLYFDKDTLEQIPSQAQIEEL